MTSWLRKKRHSIPLAFLLAGIIVAIVWVVSPWPAALMIRALFEQQADKTVQEMQPYAPKGGLDATLDVQYAADTPLAAGANTTLDVYSPSDSTGPLPTLIWIHGGAWISGDKANVDPYVRIIAAEGYTTVALNYTVAPEAAYPTALQQLNQALAFLVEHAEEYRIDPERLAIAGDSAGSNLTSQLAVLTTSPAYATQLGIEPALTPEQLRAVVLNCGIYDVSGIPNAPGLGGWGFRIALWAYLGDRDWEDSPGDHEMSTIESVTADFPTTWISGGNGDPLTESQSKPLATKLEGLGVDVTTVFYPADETPSLPHEYQFHLDFDQARVALDSTLDFLGNQLKR